MLAEAQATRTEVVEGYTVSVAYGGSACLSGSRRSRPQQ
jgi:hypothetical protein